MNVTERINKLRELMRKNGMDAYLIDNSDFHSSEYVNNYFKERSYMSSFDGSNGKLLVTMDEAFLWTDGRYFLQAEKDLKNTPIKLMKMGVEGYPTLVDYIATNLEGKTFGLDGRVFSYQFVDKLSLFVTVKAGQDLVDLVFENRPKIEFQPIWFLPFKYSGETTSSKIAKIREMMKEEGETYHVLTSIDDIAYLYNLRGNDVDITPVFLSFAVISLKDAYLFCNKESLNEDAIKELKKNHVIVQNYDLFADFLKQIHDEKILIDLSRTNYYYVKLLEDNNTIVNVENPTILMKAVKNEIQNRNNRKVHEYDGLAVFRFMKNLKEMFARGEHIDEYQQAEFALKFRKMCPLFYEVSFDSISSWNENGAIIHYEPTKESSKTVEGSGFFLLDSGGQYMGGTTDITRTFQLGAISEEMKHHYTMVLKGFIAVSKAKFLKGSSGQNLDMLAREPFWKEGLDYRHGTGHGVGYMLNVHEGPQGIRYQKVIERSDSALFQPGMVTSIEPGLYLAGKYGIRIEDEILCVKDSETEWGEFYKFETLTVAPIDLDPVIVKELSKEERKWLNDYHRFVYRKLSKLCNEDELDYLKHVTRKI